MDSSNFARLGAPAPTATIAAIQAIEVKGFWRRGHNEGSPMIHRSWIPVWIAAWIFVLLAPALAAQNTPPARGVNFYSIAKEQALGAQLAADYRQHVHVIDSAAVTAYLDQLGQRIAAKAEGAGYTYTFELVDDDQTFLHEPIAFPGGPVFVPAGLILTAESEGELAGMLAHAIAHIAARHGTKQATKDEIVNRATIPLISMGGSQGSAIRQGQALSIPFGMLKFQRQSELEADAVAVQSMAAAGYDPAFLAGYIGRVQPAEPLPNKVLSAIPDRALRLAALRSAIQSLPAASYPAHDGFAFIREEVARLVPKSAKTPPRLAR